MKPFDVLDRHTFIHQHLLLEASAGTGKTFSIQHIVTRLLLATNKGEEPLLLSQILLVTFTRAATRDLKYRVRTNLQESLHLLESSLYGKDSQKIPDYIQAIIETGKEAVEKARNRLQEALLLFDQASIFTIHSFCARMLRQFPLAGDLGLHAHVSEEHSSDKEKRQIIADFFRTELDWNLFFPAQIAILLKGDPNQQKLIRLMQRQYSFPPFSTSQEMFFQWSEKMNSVKIRWNILPEKLLEDFIVQSSHYRNHTQGMTKKEVAAKIAVFAHLFGKNQWTMKELNDLVQEGLLWIDALHPSLQKKGNLEQEKLHYPHFTEEIRKSLDPLIRSARDFSTILSRVAAACGQLLQRRQLENEKLSPDDLLYKMGQAIHRPSFVHHIREQYQAAIIDEFQDTDPLQWEIFRKIFFAEHREWKGYCHLVGDPKQSIYSFRQADIYTYLDAAKTIGENGCYSLTTNYRSHRNLIYALNALFSSENLPSFIALPTISHFLSYEPVHPPSTVDGETIRDHRGAVHFFCCDRTDHTNKQIDSERDIFFPFILQEIRRIHEEQKYPFSRFAVLVSDRYQGSRLAEFFDEYGMPYHLQRGTTITLSNSLELFKQCMEIILDPQDKGRIRIALAGSFIGWNCEEIQNDHLFSYALHWIHELRNHLFDKGFASFFEQFIRQQTKPNGKRIIEVIMEQNDGMHLYEDLEHIAHLVIKYQGTEWKNLEGISLFLNQLREWGKNGDDRIQRFQDPMSEGVKIATIHVSKGLEFPIVFALGLINRHHRQEDVIPFHDNGKKIWAVANKQSQEYQKYCEEQDAEKIRQLYVACTRAKVRLYIPAIFHPSQEKIAYGETSPLDLFFARLGQRSCSYEELYERIASGYAPHIKNFLHEMGKSHSISYSLDEKHNPSSLVQPHFSTLVSPPQPAISFSQVRVSSFSSLVAHGPQKEIPFISVNKNRHTLPAHAETGKFLHTILQKISFRDFASLHSEQEAIPLIQPFIQDTFFEEWLEVITSMIYRTLSIEISQISPGFCLSLLEPHHVYREMPFIFSQTEKNLELGHSDRDRFMKGVIDLLFFYNGHYYLVDWKTNWLGENEEAYHTPQLEIAMEKNSYYVQANIYKEMARKYLKVTEKRSFKECFGGVFYLFLRGLAPGKNTGIYFYPLFLFYCFFSLLGETSLDEFSAREEFTQEMLDLQKLCEEGGKELLGETTYLLLGLDADTPPCIAFYGDKERNDKVRITFINGILNTYQDVLDSVELLCTSHGRTKIHYICRPTQGWTWDISLAVMVKLAFTFGYRSSCCYLLADVWRSLIEEMGGVEGGGTIMHYGHSLGGSETDRACELLTPEEQKMIRVITFGSPTLVRDQGFQKVLNIVSMNDGVSSLFLDPNGHIQAFFDPNTNVKYYGTLNYTGFFFDSSAWPMDHLLNGPTYGPLLWKMGEEFLQEFPPIDFH